MGRAARDFADYTVVTSDNPRGEDPRAIISDIERGIAGGEYEVVVDKPLTIDFIRKMERGVHILDTVTLPCKLRKTGDRSFNIILTQGLNRQIRRMCEALGYRVRALRRIRIMHLRLGNLKLGQWRNLSPSELAELMRQLEG